MDIKKLGRIPDGGGWKTLGRTIGNRHNKQSRPRSARRSPTNAPRPYRPQTNGKVERFNRTLFEEWAYAHPYHSETERVTAFANWLHSYNHHRGHTALRGATPASRVTNLSGHNS